MGPADIRPAASATGVRSIRLTSHQISRIDTAALATKMSHFFTVKRAVVLPVPGNPAPCRNMARCLAVSSRHGQGWRKRGITGTSPDQVIGSIPCARYNPKPFTNQVRTAANVKEFLLDRFVSFRPNDSMARNMPLCVANGNNACRHVAIHSVKRN